MEIWVGEIERQFVSVKTLCQILDIGEETIRMWVKKKTIPYFKVGKLVRFNLEEVKGFMTRVDFSKKKFEIARDVARHEKV